MLNLLFFEIFKEILRIFEDIFKCYRNFRQNLGRILENFGNMDLQGFGRGGAPRS